MAPNVRSIFRLEPRTTFRKLEIFSCVCILNLSFAGEKERPGALPRCERPRYFRPLRRRPVALSGPRGHCPIFSNCGAFVISPPQHKGDGGLRSRAAAEESRAIERRRRIFFPRLRQNQGINGLKPTKMMDIERKASYLLRDESTRNALARAVEFANGVRMLTKKGKYGLKAMVHLAGQPPGEATLVTDIAVANQYFEEISRYDSRRAAQRRLRQFQKGQGRRLHAGAACSMQYQGRPYRPCARWTACSHRMRQQSPTGAVMIARTRSIAP